MVDDTVSASRAIAPHCSGFGARQWRQLGEILRAGYDLVAPEQYGCKGTAGPWTGTQAFTLADEAAKIIAIIDIADRKVHLVGHSYGGDAALRTALTRPDRIASLILYQPSAFHLKEIVAIPREVGNSVTGDASLVDYRSEKGAWSALRPGLQSALTCWVPKALLDFAASVSERKEASAYASLRFPVLFIRGQQATALTLLIAEKAAGALARSLPHRNRRRQSHGPDVACGGRGRIDAAIAHHELTRIRSQHRKKVHEHIVAASTLILMFLPLSVASAQVPDAIAATGEGLIATVHAEGAQVYECQAGTGVELAWQFREPIATLLMDGKTVGRHYAGPSWELTDGSAVIGKVAGRAPGSTSKDIPLLKLEVMSQRGSGQLTGVTTIQRLNTKGGIAEGSCESAGAFLSVPYSADYTFYQRRFGNKRSMNLEKLDGYLAVSRRRSSRPTGGRIIMPPQ
jgi:pimeloyl-ACP methyl ester carboxylesterase